MIKEKIKASLQKETLKNNLWKAVKHTLLSRKKIVESYSNWEELREKAFKIRKTSIENLDKLWEGVKNKIQSRGGNFFIVEDEKEALKIVEDILEKHKNFPIVKSKSMVSEEVGIREYLEKKGYEIYETDLGELIVQWEGKPPSHITAPAIHLSRFEIAKIFEEKLNLKVSSEPEELTKVAREFLREKFLKAKASIVGANFILSENGSLVLLENEGNIRFCLNIPEEVIILTGYEKIIPKIEDLIVFLKLLPPSATGQLQNCYTSFVPLGKKHHLIVLKSFREKILNSERKEILYCIRCGACINTCPVFSTIGGHSYSSVYPGPIGLILSFYNLPSLSGDILNLCSLCFACSEICPVKIPIPEIILKGRASVGKGFLERFISKSSKIISNRYFFNLTFKVYNFLPLFLKKIFMKKWIYNRNFLDVKRKDFFKLWKERN
ncbi:MAG: lactate utilization protein B [Thermoanaerobaculia bacterium]